MLVFFACEVPPSASSRLLKIGSEPGHRGPLTGNVREECEREGRSRFTVTPSTTGRQTGRKLTGRSV